MIGRYSRVGASLAMGTVLALSASGVASATSPHLHKIVAVAAENEYADVLAQVGGRDVTVTAIMSNPNIDPHTFEASPSAARAVAGAQIVLQNGLGYDTFMNRVESAAPNPKRVVVDAQRLLGLPDTTSNPHLWYSTRTMPAVAQAVAKDLEKIDPAESAYFKARLSAFDRSLRPWLKALAKVQSRFPHAPVATTEPVGDYLLQAAGVDDLTPFTLQADVMNGVDPAPQAVAFQEGLLSGRKVQALLYNEQVTDSLTATFVGIARKSGVPVVALYETMPTGFHYQSWMLEEVEALTNALSSKKSTARL